MNTISRWISVAGVALGLLAQPLAAQTYPDKPVRIVVGYSPGGLPDTVARIVAQKLGDRWGQNVIVENRPGANSNIAAEFVVKAPADGYTLLATDNSTVAINPFMYGKANFDAATDLLPVTMLARAPLFLAVHPSVAANTFQELLAMVKSRPGQMTYGSSGIGSSHHLSMEYMKHALGLDIVHVPFKGTGQSVPALISGQVPMVFSAYPSLSAYAKDGRVKLLAVNSARRYAQTPNLPAIAETVPGFDFAPTIGLYAPRGTPAAVVTRIAATASDAVAQPDTVTRMTNLGIETVGSTPQEYAAALKLDVERYAQAIKASGAKAE